MYEHAGLESVLRSRGDISVSSEGRTNVGGVVSALSLDGLIGVAGLSVNSTVLDDVLEGIVHQTTIASIVSIAGGAVHQVLLGEGDKVSSGNLVDTLSGSSGGEGPAVTA